MGRIGHKALLSLPRLGHRADHPAREQVGDDEEGAHGDHEDAQARERLHAQAGGAGVGVNEGDAPAPGRLGLHPGNVVVRALSCALGAAQCVENDTLEHVVRHLDGAVSIARVGGSVWRHLHHDGEQEVRALCAGGVAEADVFYLPLDGALQDLERHRPLHHRAREERGPKHAGEHEPHQQHGYRDELPAQAPEHARSLLGEDLEAVAEHPQGGYLHLGPNVRELLAEEGDVRLDGVL